MESIRATKIEYAAMKKTLYLSIILFISSCSKHYVVSSYNFEEKKLDKLAVRDEEMFQKIQPYKDSLDVEMNVVLAISDVVLSKSQPESDLGNLMCDLMLQQGLEYYGSPIDFSIMNYGGIRIPSLPAGNITYGNVIELMPFENRLGVMKLRGDSLLLFFNHMAAKGGWPVSNAKYSIKGGSAVDIQIAGYPLNLNKEYVFVTSDYLLQGGDNCTMLQNTTYTDLKKTVREALVEGLQSMSKKGLHINNQKEGRVLKVN
jgi:2',3'-cyclic-nucleotide 2'-phosphodiesterase (5'-nucleotidase family)